MRRWPQVLPNSPPLAGEGPGTLSTEDDLSLQPEHVFTAQSRYPETPGVKDFL